VHGFVGERQINLLERDRLDVRAQSLESCLDGELRWNTDLQPLHIIRRAHGTTAVRKRAEAPLEVGDPLKAGGLELLSNPVPGRRVQRAMRVLVVVELVRD